MKPANKLAIPVLLAASFSFAESNTATTEMTEGLPETAVSEAVSETTGIDTPVTDTADAAATAVNEIPASAPSAADTELPETTSGEEALQTITESTEQAFQVEPAAESLISDNAEPAATAEQDAPAAISDTKQAQPSVDINPQTTQFTETNQSAVKVNIVEVNEVFYKLTFDPDTNTYQRRQITEAKPGDLIELVISAENKSDTVLTNIELVNFVPEGPVQLLLDSIKTDEEAGLYRLSRDGNTYFPADAQIDSADINFIQWVIHAMQPGDSEELSYRISINRQ